jgi:NADP-dependent 3-hydroxy acid dehydrogenase YdfG
MPSQLVWFITGCSSGFGEQFVHSILARGDKVIATGRNLSRLQHLQNTGASILQLDVTDSQEIINDKIAEAISIHGRIDVLVNNAAFIQVGTWEDLSAEDFRAQFETNVFGTLKVTKALLPHFRQRKMGVNVFISSLSGWIGHDFCGAYAGSKFALEGTSQCYEKRQVDGLTYAWQVSSSLSGAKQHP